MADTVQDEFHTRMSALDLKPLWERTVHNPREPRTEPACHWRWAEVEPLIDMAVEQTTMDAAERRVLSFANPHFDHSTGNCVTTNLNCGFQVLMPGETARVHRHSANALRFVIEGGNGTTTVEGKPCPMNRGDLIVTPGDTWHEHTHDGDARIVWLDALDVPFHRYMKTAFFDPGPAGNFPPLPRDEAWHAAGIAPEPDPGEAHPDLSPRFRFAWDDVLAVLAQMKPAPDGSRRVRYTNPATGGPAMKLLDCYMMSLARGQATRPFRSTANAFCLVADGEGSSTVGDVTVNWSANDVFTLPHWSWYSHRAETPDAKLFMVTDREIVRRVELLREEYA